MAEITSAKAMARTVRVSPRKTRLVLDLIRGKNVADAIAILKFTPNKAARIVEKTLNSAIANAENNFGLEKANLVVSETFANEGPTMKRFRPRAKGSASPINKRTTHVTVVVSENKEVNSWVKKYIQLVCVSGSSVTGMRNGMLKKNTQITFTKIWQSANSFKRTCRRFSFNY